MKHSDEKTIAQALNILARQLRQPGVALSSPVAVKQFLTLRLAQQEREVFGALWLDVTNSLVAVEDMFYGTLDKAPVYPREVVKSALANNSASAIFFHNHPSGRALPSDADKLLTSKLKDVLDMIDVRTLDHIIVGGVTTYSFAENGLI